MFTLFDKEKTASLFVESASEPIALAVRDLQRDLRRLAAREDGFELSDRGEIRILTAKGEPESYTVEITERGVTVVGGDVLGTVFGIYAFATRALGISPTHRLDDVFPAPHEALTLKETRFESPKRAIRFRGWFLNDEDLLTEFKESGGVRHIDYSFYQVTMHEDVLDMILETALRLEINLVIPSSFVDIDNPDEEKLVKTTYRRGLYISQHHVEPLGVSYFGAKNYIKKHDLGGEVSFLSNRAVMEEIWSYYAKKWAAYKDRVIWQFGLRGRADEAVWKRDKNVPLSSEGRGAVITDAIRTQYEIVKETLGGDSFLSTATLWLEGARLYGEGHLKLPEDTVAVFSDVGLDQMFGDDFYSVPREKNREYGVYYHVAFYGRGPHLADTCNPLKTDFSYKEAAKMNSLTYSIVNVSNVRPLHYSATANAALMADPEGFDYEKFATDFHRQRFGDAAELVKSLRNRFYLACGNMGEDVLKKICDEDDFYYHNYGKLPFARYTFDDGDLYMMGRKILKGMAKSHQEVSIHYDELVASAKRFETLLDEMRATEGKIPTESLDYYRTFLLYQTEYMMLSTKWCAYCVEMNAMPHEQRCEIGEKALECLHGVLKAREIEACAHWQGWHNGEKKLNVNLCVELTRNFYE